MSTEHKALSPKKILSGVISFVFFFLVSNAALGQNYNLRFVRVSNNGTTLTIKVQASLTSAENMGSSNLVFTYDGAQVNTPVLGTIHNFSGSDYQTMTLTSPATNTVSLNIEYTGANGGGTALATGASFTDVAEISFTLPDETGTANFVWQENTTTKTVVYQDDNSSLLSKGTLTNNDMSLDGTAPTVGIVVTDAALKAGETTLVTFTFSEVVTGFANADVTIPNGTMTAVSSADGGTTYTATFTPTADVEDATNVFTVDKTGVTDGGDNLGVGTTDSGNFTIDTQRPTVTAVVTDAALIAGETTLVTFTFSEVVTGFANADVTIPNGTMTAVSSADGGTTYTATFTPTASISDATNVFTVDNTGVTDGAGNTGTGTTNSGNFTINTQRPTVTAVVTDAALQAGETTLVTFTFSEVVTGFANDDITIPNGTMTAVSSADGGTTYTATFTPTGDVEDATNVFTVDNTGVTNGAGNAGTGTTDSGNFTIDTQRPTVTAVVTDAALIAGETTLVTFTFSEVVTGFANADITIPNGTMTGVSSADGGTTYTATFTPTGDIEDATNIFTVDNTGVSDGAGNTGTGTTDSGNFTIDTQRPTVTAVVTDAALTTGETTLVTFTFSEVVTGFANDDITIPNGTMTTVSSADGGTTYTATFTPTASISDATNVFTVDNTGVTDAAGNIGSGTTDSGNFTIDTNAPTVTVVVTDAALTIGETTLVTFTFSEMVTGFAPSDVTVSNGTMSAVSSSDGGTTYTATFTPTGDVEDATNVFTVDNTGVTNGGGNPGVGTTDSGNFTIDTQRPTVTAVVTDAVLSVGETTLVTFTFSEVVTGFANVDVTIPNGSMTAVSSADGGTTYTATFTPTGDVEDATNVFTVDNTGVSDGAGNAGTGTTDSGNFTIDTQRPTVTAVVTDAALQAGETTLVTFTFSEVVTGFANDDITIPNGTMTAVSSADGGTTYTATFTPTGSVEDATNVFTVDNTGVTDGAGNTGTGTTDSGNFAIDTQRPTVTAVVTDAALQVGETTLVTFTFSEVVTGFANADITIPNGTMTAVSSADGGTTYTATFTPTGSVEDATNVFTVDNTGVADGAGNTGTGTTDSGNFTIDTQRPTVTTVVTDAALTAGETTLVTFTFSETVTGFANADITIPNGTMTAVSSADGGTTYTATFTPTASISDATNVFTVDNTGVTDGAGNAGTGTTDSGNFTINTQRPTVTAVVTDAALQAGETTLVTFTFSEVVTGFANADITIPNGTMTEVSSADGGTTYTATFTPTGDIEDATNVFTVDNTGLTNGAGNAGTGTTDSGNFTIDTQRPTVTAVVTDPALIAGETTLVTFTFSEVVTGFANADITIPNGTMTAVSSGDGGTTYTATFTPTVSVEDATNVFRIDNTGVTDGAGNAGTGTTDSGNFTIDTQRPTVTAVVTDAALTTGETTLVTFTFSEVVTGFANADITIPNGTMTAVSSGDGGTTYTGTFTPTASLEDATNVFTVDNTGVTDAAGNAGSGTTDSGNFTIDTNVPTVTVVVTDAALTAGETTLVTFTFSEVVTGFANVDVTIPNGTMTGVSSADGGTTYTATFTPTGEVEDATNVFTVDNTGVTDDAGNAGTGTTDSGNFTIDTKRPTVGIVVTDAALVAGETTLVTFTFSEVVTGFSNADVTIPNGTMTAVSSADGGTTYTATFTPTVSVEDATNVFTVDNTGVTDGAGNTGTGTTDSGNFTIETKSPTVISVTSSKADGTYGIGEAIAITVTFSEAVTVTGTPQIELETGVVDRTVDYTSGSGTTILTFNYTTESGDESADLDYKTTNALTLNGGTINDGAGNTGTLMLASPGAANSLGNNKAIVIEAFPTVTLSVGNSSVAEASGTSTITATLSQASSQDVTVTLGYTGTAINGTDYNNTASTTITITAGQTTANAAVGITATQDASPETNETIIVDITGVTKGVENGMQQETVTITDDDTPSVAFSSTASSGLESVSSSNIPVNLSIASGLTVTVDYVITGTATGSGTDFTLAAGTLTFNPASTTENIPLAGIIDDLFDEVDETVIMTLSNPTNANLGTNQTHTYTITDNDNPPVIAFTSTSSNGAESVSNANLEVSLDAVSGKDATVDYTITGTATGSGTDFTLAAGTLTITAGSANDNITIADIIEDALDETDETVIVTLSNPGNATLGTNTVHIYTINDNDATPTIAFTVTDSNAAESTASANLQVGLSTVSGKDVTVDYAITGTATGSGTDFTLAAGTLTITAGAANDNITIASIVEDALDEADETVIVTLSNPGNATLGTNTVHTYTINDNDASPTIAFAATSSNAAESTSSANLQVDLSAVSGQDVTVDYAITGTATGSGTDFTLAAGTLTITAGSANNNITIAGIVEDALDEVDETVIVTLSNPGNATLGTNTVHTYTINDNDAEPTVAFGLTADGQSESEPSQDIQVSLSAISGKTITVDYAVTGTATAGGTDHTTAGGTITFNPGEQDFQQQIVGIVDDALDEADETIILTLSNPTNATLGGQNTLTYTITDNDAAPAVTLSVSANSIVEAAGTSTVTATLSAVSGQDVTVTIGYSGTAVNGTDYNSSASTSITISAGSISADTNVGLTATQDSDPESTETIIVDITNVVNGSESGMQQQVITIIDDDAPVVNSVGSTTADDSYKAGDVIDVTITFNQTVVVVGTPQLTLETGVTDRTIDYASGSGSSILTFTYTVQSGDVSADLDYLSTSSLGLNSGTIKSVGGIDAVLTLAVPGTAGSLGDSKALVIDTAIPVAPTVSDITTDTGVDSSDEITSDNTLFFNGTAEANSTVEVFIGGISLGTTTADGSGNFSFDHSGTTLADGTISVTATATDAAGNASGTSTALSVTVDTSIATPSVTSITTDSGSDGSDEITSDNTLMFNGTAEATSTVEVFIGGISIGTTTADGSGNFSFDHTGTALGDGTISVTAKATDAAGNISSESSGLSVQIDTTVPSTPTLTGITNDTGQSTTDQVTNSNMLAFNGTSGANNTVEVFIGGVSIGTTTADGSGAFTFDHSSTILADGTISVTVKATDPAGNVSSESMALSVTVDTAVESPTVDDIDSDSGSDATDKITNDNTLIFTGTSEPGARLKVTIDGLNIGNTVADESGNWSLDYSGTTLADGTISVAARAQDVAGNNSEVSSPLSVTIDTDSMTPTVDAITNDSGSNGTDKVTNDNTLIFMGTSEPEARLKVTIDGLNIGNAVADGSGNWSLDYTSTALADGTISVAARAQDVAGNNSLVSTGTAVTVDTSGPTVSISNGLGSPTDMNPIPVTITFSESVTGFDVGDLVVANGTAANFSGSGSSYTADITPTASGAVMLDIMANVAIDLAGNNNTAATQFSILYNNIPTDIISSSASIPENNTVGDPVGTLSTTDADPTDTHTYSKVSGTGDTDNDSFTIDGTTLKAAEVFDFETKSSYSIRVSTLDNNGGAFEKVLTITITNVLEGEIVLTGDLVFDATALGLSQTKNLTLTNSGEKAVEARVISLPAGFSMSLSSTIVNVGESVTAPVVFRPTEARAYSGLLVVEHEDGQATIAVSGEGVVVTDIDDNKFAEDDIAVKPNPSKDYVTIDLSDLNGAVAALAIVDGSGVRMMSLEDIKEESVTVDVRNYSQGIYILQISTERSTIIKKIIIRR